MRRNEETTNSSHTEVEKLKKTAEHIYHSWEKALSSNDVEGLLRLYAPDAILESPLVPHLLEQESGICSGHKNLRRLIEKVAQRKPTIRGYFSKNYFTDGKTIMFEYPRQTPDGEQMDFIEVMEINDGLIQYHRVYWGWCGFKVIKENRYHRE
ncbi:MAG: nuclear transport factor 2 family protein [Legionellaceae bacterium]|nr:nuclear transport factor 2 family protein [Legionellaceae bacterium]